MATVLHLTSWLLRLAYRPLSFLAVQFLLRGDLEKILKPLR